jgi:hypothetical protein
VAKAVLLELPQQRIAHYQHRVCCTSIGNWLKKVFYIFFSLYFDQSCYIFFFLNSH